MTKDRLKYLLDRYLENTATPGELQEYNDWCDRQAGGVTEDPLDENETRKLFAEIMDRINTHGTKPGVKALPGRKRYIQYMKWAAAAILAGAVLMLLINIRLRRETTIAHNIPVASPVKQNTVVIENRTAGEKLVRLKDGSLARLFAGSTLRYREPFGENGRNILLDGKGFFDVAKDPARPFTVHAAGIATTALGTSFTISACKDKKEVTVSLHSGRVVVRDTRSHQNGTNEIYLLPGQQLACNIETGRTKIRLIKSGTEAGEASSLAPGSRTGFAATFDQAPMDSVLAIISKGYEVNLKYNREELSSLLFSGSIRETDSLSQVLKRIEVLYNVSVKPAGKQFIIRKSH